MGMPCDLTAILAFGRAHAIPVIEDAACAIGSEILWRGHWERIGRPHGDIACFSFHPRKIVSTGDGGMITTANAALDQKCRLLRQHGMSVPDTVRHGSAKVIFEEYPVVGFNCRMTDIQAAVGREQLKRVPDIVASRRSLADRYRSLLSDTGIRVPLEPEFARSNWQSYCVRLPDHCDQRTVMQRMLDAGIASRRGIMCSHREAAYSDVPLRQDLKHSEEAQDRCILLPLYPQMTEAEQDRVVSVLTEACRDHRAVFVGTIGNVAHAEPIPA
jgi:dTDP-4-amino-4,6-dideoxygalactose transaminase